MVREICGREVSMKPWIPRFVVLHAKHDFTVYHYRKFTDITTEQIQPPIYARFDFYLDNTSHLKPFKKLSKSDASTT